MQWSTVSIISQKQITCRGREPRAGIVSFPADLELNLGRQGVERAVPNGRQRALELLDVLRDIAHRSSTRGASPTVGLRATSQKKGLHTFAYSEI